LGFQIARSLASLRDPQTRMAKYFTAPIKTTGMPPGVPYIVGNEAAERFSYYGMRSILTVFMTQYLVTRSGALDVMKDEVARAWYHWFVSAVYFFPFFGAILADAFLGKYRTILILSIVYCFGHLTLALDSTRIGLLIGLSLIAIGSGGIKPCVSANVGDQFGATNQHLIQRVFTWFYFSINFGSFFSMLLIPYLLKEKGPHVAFGVPGILMFIATVVFWLGRKKFAHIPPGGMQFIREAFSVEGRKIVLRLVLIFIFIAAFWSLYDQTASAWVLQAKQLDRHFLGHEWLSSQIQAANPLLILIFIPLFSYWIFPTISRVVLLTPLRKISIGFFLTAISFLVPAWLESQISAGKHPNVSWQLLAYMILTAAEVFVSLTGLEFAYTQAPRKMKSLVMSLFLGSVWLGNAFTALVNMFIQNADGTSKLSGASYYFFFTGVMTVTAIAFIVVAYFYKEQTFLQDEAESA
jgi:POT family proton-dependent oligopeptide transporter